LKFTRLFLSLILSFSLYSEQLPYIMKILSFDRNVNSYVYCNGLKILSNNKVYILKGDKFYQTLSLPFKPKAIYCEDGNIVFYKEDGLYSERGKKFMVFDKKPLKIINSKGKIFVLFKDKFVNLKGKKIILPSPPLIIGKNVILGKDYAMSFKGEKFELKKKVEFEGLRENLAELKAKNLFYAVNEKTVCVQGVENKCYNTEWKIKAIGIMKNIFWAISSIEDGGKLHFFSLKSKLPSRLNEQIIAYEPKIISTNGEFLVVSGIKGPVEIYPYTLDLAFSLPGLHFSVAQDVKMYDIDTLKKIAEKQFYLDMLEWVFSEEEDFMEIEKKDWKLDFSELLK